MTAANVEAAILEMTKGYGSVSANVEYLDARLSDCTRSVEKLTGQLDARLARHDQTLADIATTLALLKKDVDDLKSRADEARKNRWALSIAILSALLSLGSAILVTFVKKP